MVLQPTSDYPRTRVWRSRLSAGLFAAAILALSLTSSLVAEDVKPLGSGAGQPALITNETGIAETLKPANGLRISDPKAVFTYVLESLPSRVKVYPSENYYYFTFLHGGVPYAGNLRLDANDRNLGKLHFAYFRRQTPWMGTSAVTHLVLDQSDGIAVTKAGPLIYRVKNGTASVIFELNDLSHVRPPRESVLANEEYIGPVFDESGVRFFLVFNRAAKVFHYVFDETGPVADRLASTGVSDRVRIGMRTGFAFYDDHRTERKLLIGIYADNERLNTHLDGPFDQLPDNFIKGENLRRAILEIEPDLAGKIGRLGHYHDGETRYLIAPYVRYQQIQDLEPVDDCATKQEATSVSYAACFGTDAVDASQ